MLPTYSKSCAIRTSPHQKRTHDAISTDTRQEVAGRSASSLTLSDGLRRVARQYDFHEDKARILLARWRHALSMVGAVRRLAGLGVRFHGCDDLRDRPAPGARRIAAHVGQRRND